MAPPSIIPIFRETGSVTHNMSTACYTHFKHCKLLIVNGKWNPEVQVSVHRMIFQSIFYDTYKVGKIPQACRNSLGNSSHSRLRKCYLLPQFPLQTMENYKNWQMPMNRRFSKKLWLRRAPCGTEQMSILPLHIPALTQKLITTENMVFYNSFYKLTDICLQNTPTLHLICTSLKFSYKKASS